VIPDPSPEALDTLARTLYGEARGESVRGKEAVAAVVVNRVKRAAERGGWWWGNTVVAVCKKPWQFSAWNEDDPNRPKIESATEKDREFASCLRIAKRAVMDALQDPTQGATHYHAKGITPPWARDRTPSAVIGDHLFYNNVE